MQTQMLPITQRLSNLWRPTLRSRAAVGFHRLGIVLGAPCLAAAITLAILQWKNPTGPLVTVPPTGAVGYFYDQDKFIEDAANEILDQQRRDGLEAPAGMMIVGLPMGTVRFDNSDWTKFQLVDGRKIGVASTDKTKASETARDFLLGEKRLGRDFVDTDEPINIDNVRVTFLGEWAPKWAVNSPWLHKARDWTLALAAFCAGVAAYTIMRALGWVIDGFVSPSPSA
jgi:hypothetical protein